MAFTNFCFLIFFWIFISSFEYGVCQDQNGETGGTENFKDGLTDTLSNVGPLPKFECNYDTPVQCPIRLRPLGEDCLLNSDCLNPGICYNSTCQCPGQLLEYDGQCLRAPGLDENCLNDQCLSPFTCFRGKCDCPSSMKKLEGKCKLECKETEIETPSECVTVAKLGAACTSNLQCHTAFSYCFQGKCHCVAGTKAAGESCQAAYNCPNGQQPLKSAKGDHEKCVSLFCPSTGPNVVAEKVKLDSCPLNSYCVIPSYQDSEGFCCPDTPYCPMGEPMPDKKCTNPSTFEQVCPTDTHHCYAGLRGVHCCPLPCPSIPGKVTIVYQEKCYVKKDLGETCQVSAQCNFGSECANFTCQCPDGYVTQFVDSEARCRKVCQPDEVLAGQECLDIVAPMQECKVSSQCTGGTRCKDGKCQCPCNRPMYNGVCMEETLCPNYGYGSSSPLLNKRSQLIECVPNSPKYGSCEAGYYCSTAPVYAGGVCCPLPDAMCDNGRRPPKDKNGKYGTCNDRYPNCARGEYCKDYVFERLPWMGRFKVDGVCCSQVFNSGNNANTNNVGTLPQLMPSSLSDANCPSGHKLEVDMATGQPKTCNFLSYTGECGTTSACFKFAGASNNGQTASNKSGLCCRWTGR